MLKRNIVRDGRALSPCVGCPKDLYHAGATHTLCGHAKGCTKWQEWFRERWRETTAMFRDGSDGG